MASKPPPWKKSSSVLPSARGFTNQPIDEKELARLPAPLRANAISNRVQIAFFVSSDRVKFLELSQQGTSVFRVSGAVGEEGNAEQRDWNDNKQAQTDYDSTLSEIQESGYWKIAEDPRFCDRKLWSQLGSAPWMNPKADCCSGWYARRVQECTTTTAVSSSCVCWECDPFHTWWSWFRPSPHSTTVLFRVSRQDDPFTSDDFKQWTLTPMDMDALINLQVHQHQQDGYVYIGQHQPTSFFSTLFDRHKWVCPRAEKCQLWITHGPPQTQSQSEPYSHCATYYHPSVRALALPALIHSTVSPVLAAAWSARAPEIRDALISVLPSHVIPLMPHVMTLLTPSMRRCWKIKQQDVATGLEQSNMSKCHGPPYLRSDEEWPICTHCHGPMWFQFQMALDGVTTPSTIANIIQHGETRASSSSTSASTGTTLVQLWLCFANTKVDPDRRCRRAIGINQSQSQSADIKATDQDEAPYLSQYLIRVVHTHGDMGHTNIPASLLNPFLLMSDPWDAPTENFFSWVLCEQDDVPHSMCDPTFPTLSVEEQVFRDWCSLHRDDLKTIPRHGTKLGGFPRFSTSQPDDEYSGLRATTGNAYPTCDICHRQMTFIMQLGTQSPLTPYIYWSESSSGGGHAHIFQCLQHIQQFQLVRHNG